MANPRVEKTVGELIRNAFGSELDSREDDVSSEPDEESTGVTDGSVLDTYDWKPGDPVS